MAKDDKPPTRGDHTASAAATAAAAAHDGQTTKSIGPYKVCEFSEFHCGRVYRPGESVDPAKEENLRGVDFNTYVALGILIPVSEA